MDRFDNALTQIEAEQRAKEERDRKEAERVERHYAAGAALLADFVEAARHRAVKPDTSLLRSRWSESRLYIWSNGKNRHLLRYDNHIQGEVIEEVVGAAWRLHPWPECNPLLIRADGIVVEMRDGIEGWEFAGKQYPAVQYEHQISGSIADTVGWSLRNPKDRALIRYVREPVETRFWHPAFFRSGAVSMDNDREMTVEDAMSLYLGRRA